jgi:hypothetical protein
MTTLPEFLFHSYKRYKVETNRVAAWLAETAQTCGYTLEGQPAIARPSGGRLKGKARKEARQAKTVGPAAGLRLTISANSLPAMAQSIANQTPPIRVPAFILGLLNSAITLRKRCAGWFQTKTARKDLLHERLDGHAHFISVLEQVRQILEPSSAPDTAESAREGTQHENTAQTGPAAEPTSAQTNPYDLLYLDDDASESVQTSEIPVPVLNAARVQTTPSPERKVTYELDNPTSNEETYFALFCFFDDLNQLRDFLHELWSDYKAGKVDLITVSVTTNTAIDLVRRAEKEFVTAFPRLDTYDKISEVFYMLMCWIRGEDPEVREQPDDIVNFAMLDVADWLCLPVYGLLDSFCDVIQAGHLPVMKPGHFGIYDPSTDRSKLTVRQRMREDQIILCEALPEFIASNTVKSEVPIEDEFSIGLRSMFATKKVTLWVTFAAQIFLDIHHTLRVDTVRGLSQLRTSGANATSTLDKYFATSQTFQNWPAENEKLVKNVKRFADFWIIQDTLGTAKRRMYRSSPLPPPDEPYALFRRHPLICGIIQFKLHLFLQQAGITLTTAWGSILYVAHLYHACRQGGYLEEVWPDMELIMDIHTRERIFAGRVPETAAESLKCMTLMLGASATNFARGARAQGDRVRQSRAGPKGLTSNSPVMDLFRKEYLEKGDLTLTINAVEELLHDRESTSTRAAAPQNQKLQQQWDKSHKMTIFQLLGTLSEALAAEAQMLRFDYFSFHLRCLRLLRALRTSLDDKLREYFGPAYIQDDTQLPIVVGYVLMVATGTEKFGERARNYGGFESVMLRKASMTVRQFIQQEGELECDKLKKVFRSMC